MYGTLCPYRVTFACGEDQVPCRHIFCCCIKKTEFEVLTTWLSFYLTFYVLLWFIKCFTRLKVFLFIPFLLFFLLEMNILH